MLLLGSVPRSHRHSVTQEPGLPQSEREWLPRTSADSCVPCYSLWFIFHEMSVDVKAHVKRSDSEICNYQALTGCINWRKHRGSLVRGSLHLGLGWDSIRWAEWHQMEAESSWDKNQVFQWRILARRPLLFWILPIDSVGFEPKS